MALPRDVSIPTAAAVAVLVYGIYSQATPTIADIRVGKPGDPDITDSERQAAWLAAASVAGISLLTKDPTVFAIGGATVIGMSWWSRHANEVNPATKKASAGVTRAMVKAQAGQVPDADLRPQRAVA